MLSVFICAVLAVILSVIVYATFSRLTEASPSVMIKHGLLYCESKRLVVALSGDRVAILLPEDVRILQSHFREQGMSIPHYDYVLIIEESEHPEPVFVFIKSRDEIDNACISEVLEVVKLTPLYAQLLKKYFQLSPLQTESREYIPATSQD